MNPIIKIAVVLTFIFLTITSLAQIKKFGPPNSTGITLTSTVDSCIIIGASYFHLIKVNNEDSVLWERSFNYTETVKVLNLSNNNTVVAGNNGSVVGKVVMVNGNGNTVWDISLNDFNISAMTQQDDSTLILTGFQSYNNQFWDPLRITKVNMQGDSITSAVYYSNADSSLSPRDVVTFGNKVVIGGALTTYQQVPNTSNQYGFVMVVDSALNMTGFYRDAQDSSWIVTGVTVENNIISALFSGTQGYQVGAHFIKKMNFNYNLSTIFSKEYFAFNDSLHRPGKFIKMGSNEVITFSRQHPSGTQIGYYNNSIRHLIRTIPLDGQFEGIALNGKKLAFVSGTSEWIIDMNTGVWSDTGRIALIRLDSIGDIITSNIIPFSLNKKMNIYPNPTNNIISISYKFSTNIKSSITIKNQLGQSLQTKTYPAQVEINESFEMSDYSKGIYFIEFISDEVREVKKVVVN